MLMTSSEYMDAWNFKPTFTDSWMSEDTDILSRSFNDDPFYPLFDMIKPSTSTLPTPSVSGSDPDLPPPNKPRINAVSTGKITKRKSRATKKTTTTFITADPANFRQMVQQVTGVRFQDGQLPVSPLLKPEPQRAVNRYQGCLPTLDTSAFLLDHHQMDHLYQPAPPHTPPPDPFDFDSFSGFPTLESGKVM